MRKSSLRRGLVMTAATALLVTGIGGMTVSAEDFVPAESIEVPAGKTSNLMPVDKVSEEPIKIAAIMAQTNPFGLAVFKGQDWAAQILKDRNCTVDCISVEDFDAQKWTTTIDNCIAADYDAICFNGISEALKPVCDKGTEAGILMYAFNTEPGEGSTRIAWFGQDNTRAGELCGETVRDLIGGEGQVGIITGDFSVLGHEQRRTGARSVLDECEGIEIVGEWENNDKAEEAYNITTNMIVANPDLKAIYVTAGGPSGAAKAIVDAKKEGEIVLVCHDVLDETAPYIADGVISACIDQDPFNQGAEPVIAAFNKLVDDVDVPEVNFYDGIVATPDNVQELFPEYFEE